MCTFVGDWFCSREEKKVSETFVRTTFRHESLQRQVGVKLRNRCRCCGHHTREYRNNNDSRRRTARIAGSVHFSSEKQHAVFRIPIHASVTKETEDKDRFSLRHHPPTPAKRNRTKQKILKLPTPGAWLFFSTLHFQTSGLIITFSQTNRKQRKSHRTCAPLTQEDTSMTLQKYGR